MSQNDDSKTLPRPEDETVALPQTGSEPDPSHAETLFFDDPEMRGKAEETLKRWGSALGKNSASGDPTMTLKGAVTIREEPSWLQTLQSATIMMDNGGRSPASDDPKLSQYIIDHPLGEGGMGIVYQAQQQNLRRKVALKMLQPRLEDERELVEQFVMEAMVTGRLEHPNIVPVHDLGKAKNDRLFMGMKLVRGESLKALLKREPNDSPGRLSHYLDILSQVGDAMAYAHAEGILHRDLKPENVMVGKFGEVQVMDWGLAFAIRGKECADLKQLAGLSSGPSGTPAYMSPEQAEGNDEAIGPWSDVYLLGAMLYEILTGTPPHRGKSVLACLMAAQGGAIEAPSDRAPHRDIPYDLEKLCMDALVADCKDRIQSVEEFQEQIKLYLTHREALSLIDRARQILHGDDPKNRGDEAAKKAQWILTQALEIWPEAETAPDLLCQTLLVQIDRCLEQGFGAEALDLIEQLPKNSSINSKRRETLASAALRQMNTRRNRSLTACGLLILAIVLGTWLNATSTRLRAEDKRADAREQLPNQTRQAWESLHSKDPMIDQQIRGLQSSLKVAGWTERQSDIPNLILASSWESLQNGHLGRASHFIYYILSDTQRSFFESTRQRRPEPNVASALRSWKTQREALSKPLAALSDAILLSSWTRFPLNASETTFVKSSLGRLGAQSVLADQASGHPSEFLGGAKAAPIRYYQDLRAGEVIAIDAKSERELWRYPRTTKTSSTRTHFPRLIHYKGDWLLTLVRGSEILSLKAESGVVKYRLRLHDRCLGLIPRGGAGFYVIQPGTWGPSRSRLIPATPSRWLEAALPGANEKRVRNLLAISLGEKPIPSKAVTEKDKKAARDELNDLSRRLEGDPDHVFCLHRQALLFHALGEESARDQKMRRVLRLELSAYERVFLAQIWSELQAYETMETLVDSAIEIQARQGLNPDLNTNLNLNPAVLTRDLAEALRGSQPELARRLLAKSREMATTLEGDRFPFKSGKGWMVEKGVFGDAAEREAYRSRAEVLGGFFFSPPGITKVFDLVFLISIIVPTLLTLSLLVLFIRSFQTQRADLRSLGFRTERSRWAAFFTHPTLRWSHTFLAYTSRSERFFLFFSCLINLLTKVFMTTVLTAVTDIANMPLVLAHGHVGHPTLESFILDSQEGVGANNGVAHLKLMAEGALARGKLGQSVKILDQILEKRPGDGFALNNKAFVLEKDGKLEEARSLYERAGAISGEDGQVARYNLARLAGLERPNLSVTYKGFVRVYGQSDRALRQFVTGMDFLNVVNLGPSMLSVMGKKVGAMNDGGRHLKRLKVALQRRGIIDRESPAPEALRYLTFLPTFFVVLGLVLALHLPFGTRSISVPLGERGQGVMQRIAQIMNMIHPGSLWMFQGRVIMGSLAMMLVPLLIFGIWRGFHPGLLESFAFPQIPEFFNTKNLSELTVSTWQRVFAGLAITALGILYPSIWVYGYRHWSAEKATAPGENSTLDSQ